MEQNMDGPHARSRRPFSRLASVSKAPDFGPATGAHTVSRSELTPELPRAWKATGTDTTDEVCAPIEILDSSMIHHRVSDESISVKTSHGGTGVMAA